MSGLPASLVRTVVPIVAGWVVTQALRLGVHLDQASVASAVTAGLGALWYAGFRLLEHHVHPAWGWLLGWARPPQYPAAGRHAGPAAVE